MRLRSLASLRPWLYPYNIEIIYIPISIIYYLVSYYGTVFLCINLLLTFTVIQPAAAKVINKQIKSNQYADDTTAVLSDINSSQTLFKLLDDRISRSSQV